MISFEWTKEGIEQVRSSKEFDANSRKQPCVRICVDTYLIVSSQLHFTRGENFDFIIDLIKKGHEVTDGMPCSVEYYRATGGKS